MSARLLEGNTQAVDLRRFAYDLAAAVGGIGEIREDGLVELALPSEPARRAGLPDYLTLAFESETASEMPHAELAVPGSAALDKLVALGLEAGRVAAWYAVVSNARVPQHLMERIEARIHFDRSRRPHLRTASIEARELAVFRFIVAYVADERFTNLVPVAVDAHSLGDRTMLLPQLEKAYFTAQPEQAPDLPWPAKRPYEEILQAAVGRLGDAAREHYLRYQAQTAHYARMELVKLLGYYDRTIADFTAREAAADNPENKARLQKKIVAAQAERERRVTDAVAKFKVAASARLDGVTAYILPMVRALVELEHKEKRLTQEIHYNLATNQVEPAVCPRCGQPCTTLYPLEEEAIFVCQPGGCTGPSPPGRVL